MNEEKLAAMISEKMTDFQITASELRTPTAKFVQNYFIRFLQELGVDVDKFQLPKTVNDIMTCPSSIRHSVPFIQLFGAVSEITKHIFIREFSFTDLTHPKHDRTLRILTYFDTFHTYADVRAEHVQGEMKRLFEKKDEYTRLQAEVECLQETLQHHKNMPPKNNALKHEIQQLKIRLNEECKKLSNNEKNCLKVDSDVQKTEIKVEEVSSEYSKEKEELSKLQTLIVYSPEVDQKDLKLRNYEKKKSDCEKNIQEMQNSVQEKTRQINLLKMYISELESGMQEVHTIAQLATRNKMLDNKIQSLEKRQVAIAAKESNLMERLSKTNRKVEQLKEEEKASENSIEEQLADVKKKIEEAEQKLAELMKVVGSCVGMRNQVHKMEQQVEKKVALNNNLCDIYSELHQRKMKQIIEKLDKTDLFADD